MLLNDKQETKEQMQLKSDGEREDYKSMFLLSRSLWKLLEISDFNACDF